jgi:hypothetical protein
MIPDSSMTTRILLLALTALAAGPSVKPLPLPGGASGIGFDDLRFDRKLGRLLIPAGRTGNIDLIDPTNLEITPISGFSRAPKYDEGHGQSVTSVDSGDGWLFATDRTAQEVVVVDLGRGAIVSRTRLASAPDYVRFIATRNEVWVTEPGKSRIEVFALSKKRPLVLTHASFIETPGGPESLAIDERRGRAYTHRWKEKTLAIDLATHKIASTFSAGCGDPRGIWLDEDRGFLLVGCEDGTATVLDALHGGKVLSSVKSGRGVDIIAYDAGRAHLYLPGDESATMAIIDVSAAGKLAVLGTIKTVEGAHCVTTDEAGHAYVCDPKHGQLLVVEDSFPPAPR